MEIKKNEDLHIRKSNKDVVVFIHGIFASPLQYKDLIEKIVELDYSVYAISLYPQSPNPKEYLKLNKESWTKQVNMTLNLLLKKYEYVYIVSHSLGGLLSIEYKNINQVKKLVLWAPALKPKITFKSIQIGLINLDKPHEDDYLEFCRTKGSVSPKGLVDRVYLIKPTLHLLYNVMTAKKKLKDIQIPTLVIVSKNDELVRFSTGKLVEEKIDCCDFRLLELEKSFHNAFSDEEKELAHSQIIEFIKKDVEQNEIIS